MKQVVILIIVHKPNPSQSELSSLSQCKRILGNYRLILVCPKGLDVSEYRKCVPSIEAIFINSKWHSSYRMFNRLKISPLLYWYYRDYSYVLFYELDAWVFRDELEYWCNQGYDYIGAPWFEGWTIASPDSVFFGIGNGGFSLRKVSSHLKALRSFSYVMKPKELWANFLKKPSFRAAIKLISSLTIRNNTFFLFNDCKANEDFFWGKIVATRFPWYKLPDMQTASRFSMELNAPDLYERNGRTLPFGCHKWSVNHPVFWSQFINFK